jgi:hypothetical protein
LKRNSKDVEERDYVSPMPPNMQLSIYLTRYKKKKSSLSPLQKISAVNSFQEESITVSKSCTPHRFNSLKTFQGPVSRIQYTDSLDKYAESNAR